MKLSLALICLTTFCTAWKQQGVYFEKNFNWATMEDDIIAAMDSGYNRIYIGFYMSIHGCQGACLQWEQLSNQARQKVFNKAQSTDSKIYLSVGGEGEFVENVWKNNETTTFGENAAKYAKSYGYHGIDFNIHLAGRSSVYSEFAASGDMIKFTSELVSCAKNEGWTREELTVTAHAPYFSLYYVDGIESRTMAWVGMDKNEGEIFSVGDLHMMMFNEDQDYLSYEEMFISNKFYNETDGTIGYGSSVQEIINLGVGCDKIAVVKPIYEDGFSIYSGYVDPEVLSDWMCKAKDEVVCSGVNGIDELWHGGYVMWTWNSYNEDTYAWPSFLDESSCE